MLGGEQLVDNRLQHFRIGRHGRGRPRHALRRHLRLDLKRRLLQPRVVAHVDRALRLRHHRGIGAHEAFRHAFNGARLVVPFRIVADGFALHESRMAPVDVWPPLALVHRAGSAHDEDRRAVDIGIVDRHLSVQQSDKIVQNDTHRLARRAGIAVRDLHGGLFMLTDQKLRLVAAVVDDAVVQAAKARARIHRDVGEVVVLQQVDDDVRLVLSIIGAIHRHIRVPSVYSPKNASLTKAAALPI